MIANINGSIEYLLDDVGRSHLVEIVGPVSPVQVGHHFEPVDYCAFLLKKLAPKVLLPVLQPFQLVGEHLRVYRLSLPFDFSQLPLDYLPNFFSVALCGKVVQDGERSAQKKVCVSHVVRQSSLDYLHR